MEITVISEEENPMLHRTDVRFRVSHAEATPDRLAVRDSLAARLNKNADEVVVRTLDTKFGMRETIGEAKVYQGASFAKDVEQDYQLTRNKIGEDVEDAAEPEVDDETEADAEPESEPEEDAADEEGEAPEADAEEAADEDDPEEAEAEDAGDEDEADAAEDEEEAAEVEADDEETEE